MACGCPKGQAGCHCPDETTSITPGVGSETHPAGDLASGGTGMSMRRFKIASDLPGGDREWGFAPGWVGFKRPLQDVNRQWDRVEVKAPAVGFHQQRVYADPTTGQAISLMGDTDVATGDHLFPAEPHAGYHFAAGNI